MGEDLRIGGGDQVAPAAAEEDAVPGAARLCRVVMTEVVSQGRLSWVANGEVGRGDRDGQQQPPGRWEDGGGRREEQRQGRQAEQQVAVGEEGLAEGNGQEEQWGYGQPGHADGEDQGWGLAPAGYEEGDRGQHRHRRGKGERAGLLCVPRRVRCGDGAERGQVVPG
ncbi:hypothetical protein [Streptomyces sp. NPDC053079]|uniref:hypothetical protein n=1 Tax=Streptomyces sp. NPDC053079 TaxID=3365697 RepID=UPI0037D2ABBD